MKFDSLIQVQMISFVMRRTMIAKFASQYIWSQHLRNRNDPTFFHDLFPKLGFIFYYYDCMESNSIMSLTDYGKSRNYNGILIS